MSKRLRADSTSENGDNGPTVLSSRSPSPETEVAHTPKYAALDKPTPSTAKMRCLLPPHQPLSFATFADYETHYRQAHTNRCAECKKNFPAARFLDLHIAENHDPIIAAKRDKGEKTYACFVEGCDKVCLDWKKRRSHLVDKHGFPKNYDFFVVNSGINARESMLRRGVDEQGHRQSSRTRRDSSITETTHSAETISASPTQEAAATVTSEEGTISIKPSSRDDTKGSSREIASIDDITSSMSSLKMVPRSIHFGKRKGPAGFAKS